MTIPIQDLTRHTAPLADELTAAANAVIDSGWFVLGREVRAFEQEFAAYLGAPHCVTNANGTDALELALRAVGVSAGDEVVTAANAGMYSTVAILATGAVPVYAEIDPRRLSLDPRRLGPALTPATKAVVLTHLYGGAGAVEETAALCRDAGVPLIEDCAECHGARVQGRALGTWGDVGCFSFYPTKNLGALGDGGACVVRDEGLAVRLQRLRQYGWEKRYQATVAGGRNSRLDEIQAAFLRRKLPHLEGWNRRRRAIAEQYNAAFAKLPLRLPLIEGEAYVGHLYVVGTERRESVRSALSAAGVGSDLHFPVPDYRQPGVASQLSRSWSLPETEKACEQVLTLPCFPEMTDDEVRAVITALQAAFA
jgi:dTDP-3-amino-2,3,6-trideoxy-4-keto-D-glucose/dTDP-3-amino-3,4,6-trideoxy-alpha-D-glucose/dTDP-2,6-dideoxy-D-kanosamine transaminase